MSEGALRDRLRAEIDSVEAPPHPQVEPVLARGRRRRHIRQAALTAGGSVAVIATVFALTQVGTGTDAGGDPTRPEPAPVAGGPKPVAVEPQLPADPGYQRIADRFDNVTRSHLPGIEPRADDIYPSDWTRDTALPAKQWEDATEWHGLFTVAGESGDQDLWVSAMYMPAGARPSLESDRAYCDRQQSTRCAVDGTADAWTVVDEMLTSADGVDTYWLRVRAVRDGGAYSNLVRVGVHTSSLQRARDLWAVDAGELRAIATDPDLAIPRPATWPLPPEGD